MLERDGRRRRLHPHGRDHRARLPPRRLQRLASALRRRRRSTRSSATSSRRAASSTSTPSCRPRRRFPTAARASCSAARRRTPRSSTATRPATATPGARSLDGFWPNADLTFGLLGTELWSGNGVDLALGRPRAARPRGRCRVRRADPRERAATGSSETFASEGVRGLLAPWVLHTGLGPDAAASGYMAQVIAVAVQEGGMPIPRGGGAKLVDALTALPARSRRRRAHRRRRRACRGRRERRAVGVRLAGGETVARRRAVIANVTPTQLYGAPARRRRRACPTPPGSGARRFRYGRAEMQIHYALSEPARWEGDERLGGTALVHVTPGLDGVSRAVNEAERGLLPAEPTVVVGQPLTMDASRAPDGSGPALDPAAGAAAAHQGRRRRRDRHRRRHVERERARALRRPHAGRDRAAHAGPRVEHRRAHRARPGRPRARRTSTSWAATPTAARSRSTRTSSGARAGTSPATARPIDGLWHVGASTHPGPGLGGGSGALVAQALLHEPKRLEGVRRLARAAKAARRPRCLARRSRAWLRKHDLTVTSAETC